jgi:uncharacterized protein
LNDYQAPRWCPRRGVWGGHAQTIWPALFSKYFEGAAPGYRRERWSTPDGDFIDVDWLAVPMGTEVPQAHGERPLLVLFHGLEGNASSHYAKAFAVQAQHQGWHYVVPHFRGCSGELNLAPRAYHAGDFEEVGWILNRLRASHQGPVFAVGISLGGNALLRWAQEAGETARQTVQALAAISAPLDLAASGHAIGRGFNRISYSRMFLSSMKPKALLKLQQHPVLFNQERLVAAESLIEFDDVFTAPIHGFLGVNDYYERCSAKPHLHRICIPALVINARNDPFIPAHSLPQPDQVGQHVTLWQPAHGGHVGFPGGKFPGHVLALPQSVISWLEHSCSLWSVGTEDGYITLETAVDRLLPLATPYEH